MLRIKSTFLKSYFRHKITKTQNPTKFLRVVNLCFVGFRALVLWWHFFIF